MNQESLLDHSPRKSRPVTASSHFGTCNHAHDPMLSVHAGVDSEDALVCAVAALKAAYETNAAALEKAGEPLRSLLTATENSLEKGLALAEAVLEGLEQG
ncbi:hypothetical protein [Pseudomonas mosselii]|uniref:hypothetical protein n=1 Tax=Pseudomonas mosselii TaxID=78327 RepID=UPI0009BD5A75|nr:hypothetical protein [Pseudomonas mosselii]ATB64893.1 hypothetical protein CLJ08_09775 [Pseudomonas mosselii]MBC3452358.1 hypothetical protein [Pseudomonas mosselii]MDH1102186.1 hypothetical protein [Pseudomonas mosselii]MDH1656293.1 hypothetical protein [Pseudomonas mosselii]MDH1716575.1 hypothetical protein [Pseudomonas mosselii]